jgi:predicted secreted protein
MGWFTGAVLYGLIWWVTWFAVLPFGTRPQADPDPNSGWRGAPEQPHIGRKLIAATLVAGLIWGGAVALIDSGWISFRHGWLAMQSD